jgi:sulfide dehydrogenase cytochrome subunit
MTYAAHFSILLLLGAGAALADEGQVLALSCANCHGPGGHSPGQIPSIDAIAAEEMAAAMRAFRSGEREGTIMNRIAKGYTDAEIDALSAYLAGEDRP